MHPLQQLLPGALTQTLTALTGEWHHEPASPSPGQDLSSLIIHLHRANFDLWHLEDGARDPRSSPAEIASLKQKIDRVNQRRNDLVEQIDRFLLDSLAMYRLPSPGAPLHSEAPGMMLDRLSILLLKIFHTEDELRRDGTTPQLLEKNHARLNTLQVQRVDLAGCLYTLWDETLAGTRRFKQYRQLKMYNDPDLNPVLYRDAHLPPSGA